jgi:hypothetical protein
LKSVIDDAKSPHSRWAGVTNLSDARVMLNYLFTMAVNTNTALKDRNDRVSELEVNNETKPSFDFLKFNSLCYT